MIPSAFFCYVKAIVSEVNQFGGFVGLDGKDCNAHAYSWNGQIDVIVALNFVGCQTLANALGDLCGLCAIGVWKEDDEFLPDPIKNAPFYDGIAKFYLMGIIYVSLSVRCECECE